MVVYNSAQVVLKSLFLSKPNLSLLRGLALQSSFEQHFLVVFHEWWLQR